MLGGGGWEEVEENRGPINQAESPPPLPPENLQIIFSSHHIKSSNFHTVLSLSQHQIKILIWFQV